MRKLSDLPYPYGWEVTGYQVENLSDTLAKAKAASVTIIVAPYETDQRQAAIVQFPGGYIAEIHSAIPKQTTSNANLTRNRKGRH